MVNHEKTQVLLEQTTAVAPERLGELVGHVSRTELDQINDSLRLCLRARLTRGIRSRHIERVLGRSKSVTPSAATQSPQPLLPMRPARSNTGKLGRAVARMSP